MATFRISQPVSVADTARSHLVLVGLPGSGKSTVGAKLARQLGRTFLDFDVEISRREGMTISEIFAQRGESYFRELEHTLTRELTELGNMILAPGGGWVTRRETVALMCPPAELVYLRISAAGALRRMGSRVDGRPLLQRPNQRAELERLLASRRTAYESANIIVDVENLYPQRVTEQILSLIDTRGDGNVVSNSDSG